MDALVSKFRVMLLQNAVEKMYLCNDFIARKRSSSFVGSTFEKVGWPIHIR